MMFIASTASRARLEQLLSTVYGTAVWLVDDGTVAFEGDPTDVIPGLHWKTTAGRWRADTDDDQAGER